MDVRAWWAAIHGVTRSQTWLHFHFSLSCFGEGNGNPLQCSCLENPRDGGTWWAAVYGVTQSQTRLKRLSSSSREHQYNCFRNSQKVENQVDKKNEWRVKSTRLLFRMSLTTATHLEIILFVQCFLCSLKFLACTKKSWYFWTFKILWLVLH